MARGNQAQVGEGADAAAQIVGKDEAAGRCLPAQGLQLPQDRGRVARQGVMALRRVPHAMRRGDQQSGSGWKTRFSMKSFEWNTTPC